MPRFLHFSARFDHSIGISAPAAARLAILPTSTTAKSRAMHILRRTALAASIALVSAGAFAETIVQPRQVGAFKNIEVSGPYDVRINAQGKTAVELTGDRKQLEQVEVLVSGDTLIVRPVRRSGFSFTFNFSQKEETPVVAISTPTLKALKAAGSGDVVVDAVSTDTFTIQHTGPGDLAAHGVAKDLILVHRGSGDSSLAGLKAANANIKMSGPGEVEVSGMSGDVIAEVSGSGDLKASQLRATRVSARMSGPGNVQLNGSSRELRTEVTGSGDLEACSLSVETASAILRGPGGGCLYGNITRFDAEVHGSGDLAVTGLNAPAVRLQMTGPGAVKLGGAVGSLHADVRGSGDLDAANLQVKNATLRGTGPGGVHLATVSDTLDADMRGSGDLQAALAGKSLMLRLSGPGGASLDGNVDNAMAQLSGSGGLDGRHLVVANQPKLVVRGPSSATVMLKNKGGSLSVVTVDREGTHQAAAR
jgi:hypothetical protein